MECAPRGLNKVVISLYFLLNKILPSWMILHECIRDNNGYLIINRQRIKALNMHRKDRHIKIILKVSQRGTKSWVCSFFEKPLY